MMSIKSKNVLVEIESLNKAKKRKDAEGESLKQESRPKARSKEYSSKDLAVEAENSPNPKYELLDSEKEEEIREENLGFDSDEEDDPERMLGISRKVLRSSHYSFEELSGLRNRFVDSPGEFTKLVETLTLAFKASQDLIAEQNRASAFKKELESSNVYYEDLIKKKELEMVAEKYLFSASSSASSSTNVAQKIALVEQVPHLSTLEDADVASFADKLQELVTNDHACTAFSSYIDRAIVLTLQNKFRAENLVSIDKQEGLIGWKLWKAQYFIDRLKECYPDRGAKSTPSLPLDIRLKDVKGYHLTVLNQAKISAYVNKIHKIYLDNSASRADIDETSAVNVLINNLVSSPVDAKSTQELKTEVTAKNLYRLLKANKPRRVEDFTYEVQRLTDEGSRTIEAVRLWIDIPTYKKIALREEDSEYESLEPSQKKFKKDVPIITFCFGCGHKGYKRIECSLCIGHPDRSNEATPWRSCKIFKKYSERYGNNKWILPLGTRADGSELTTIEKMAMEKAKKSFIVDMD